MSDTKKEAPTDFNSIANALNAGNPEELDRLMAAEQEEVPEEEEQEEVAPPIEVAEPEQPSEESVEKGETSSAEQAADDAAEPVEELEVVKRELHRYKSDAGRVPFMQRRLVELERELLAVKARTAVTGNTNLADPNSVELDAETAAQIEELRSIDPIMAKTLERIAKTAVATASSKVDNAVSTFTQHEQEVEDNRFYNEQKHALVQAVPQADAIFASPEWRDWKASLSPGRKAMAESSYAEEVTQAIYAFAADMQQRHGGPVAAPAAPAQEASAVATARQRKVNAAAEVRNPSAKAGIAFDEEKLFAEMYNQIGKENHIL